MLKKPLCLYGGVKKELQPGDTLYGPIDLTGATEDYLLKPGEIAFLDYSGISNPLRVTLEDGSYELELLGDKGASLGSTGPYYIQPNGSNQSNIIGSGHQVGVTSASNNVFPASTVRFELGSDILITGKYSIYPALEQKTLVGVGTYKYTNSQFYRDFYTYMWNDSTSWTSLGNLVFPYSQSGRAIIRRIL